MSKEDLYGNKIEEIFIRELKSSEKTNPSSISNMAKIPNKEGYQKVYKPFKEKDKGMKFHDAVKKHIKVLDSLQRKIRTRDEIENFLYKGYTIKGVSNGKYFHVYHSSATQIGNSFSSIEEAKNFIDRWIKFNKEYEDARKAKSDALHKLNDLSRHSDEYRKLEKQTRPIFEKWKQLYDKLEQMRLG